MALAALMIPAQAQDEKKGPRKERDPAKMLEKKDTDGNGTLSLAEFIEGAKDAEKATAAFKRIDTDNNGELTLEELKAAPKRGGKGRGKGKKDGAEKGGE
ncbi:MAG: EF-hand domain-containing protein [Haloferula sp.]